MRLVISLFLFLLLSICPTMASSEEEDKSYARVLEQFVDADGFVDYAGLKAARQNLNQYAKTLGNTSESAYKSWDEAAQIAFWINAYNALTLQVIIDHYPIKAGFFSSLVYPRKSIRQIDGVWDEIQFTVMGQQMTLDQIEHEVLRKQFDEPRIHVALVCAARSCPPLRNEPFTGPELDRQLDDQARRFLARPENFAILKSGKLIRLSSIFDWFGSDFVTRHAPASARFGDRSGALQAVLNFIHARVSPEQKRILDSAKYKVEFSDYDWTLNDQQLKR